MSAARRDSSWGAELENPAVDIPAVSGKLRLSVLAGNAGGKRGAIHVSEFVQSSDYSGAEDNDIRGFLDGAFRWPWNQPGQVHIRVGRVGWSETCEKMPEYGEHELFRVLMRWCQLDLPTSATVAGASLSLHIERGCERPVRLALYAVERPWNSGKGGVDGNNVSVPGKGEVWWNEAQHGEEAWGRPGASHVSTESLADVRPDLLSASLVEPGDVVVSLSSSRLTSYVEEKVRLAEPLSFLLKLSDLHEDEPGNLLSFYSAEYGELDCPASRPSLRIEWDSACESHFFETEVSLEYGRSRELPPVRVQDGDVIACTWLADGSSPRPRIEFTQDTGAKPDWRTLPPVMRPSRGDLRLRIVSARHPIELGLQVRSFVRDTWVTAGPPESQPVWWIFQSPSGEKSEMRATYEGDYVWSVEFTPDEPGPWYCSWAHELSGVFHQGPTRRFDVIARDLSQVCERLEQVAEAGLRSGKRRPVGMVQKRLMQKFLRLERSATDLIAEGVDLAQAEVARTAIRHVRETFRGKPLPDPLPMESHQLVTTVGGKKFEDPYPLWRGDSCRQPSNSDRWRWRSLARRIVRKLKRVRLKRGG